MEIMEIKTFDSGKGFTPSKTRFSRIVLISVTFFLLIVFSCADRKNNSSTDLIIIKEQGSFSVGGTLITNPGTFNPYNPTSEGQTFHGTMLMFFIRFLIMHGNFL